MPPARIVPRARQHQVTPGDTIHRLPAGFQALWSKLCTRPAGTRRIMPPAEPGEFAARPMMPWPRTTSLGPFLVIGAPIWAPAVAAPGSTSQAVLQPELSSFGLAPNGPRKTFIDRGPVWAPLWALASKHSRSDSTKPNCTAA